MGLLNIIRYIVKNVFLQWPEKNVKIKKKITDRFEGSSGGLRSKTVRKMSVAHISLSWTPTGKFRRHIVSGPITE